MMNRERLNILSVPFDVIDLRATVEQLHRVAKGEKQWFCVTPNPEICLLASKDTDYLLLLQKSNLSIPDGFGILWAARFLKGKTSYSQWLWTLLSPNITRQKSPFPERVTGTDVMKEFCRRYPDQKIFLLGARADINATLARQLKSQGVNIVGHLSGDASKEQELKICRAINASGATVLFVAFGAPKQERWIGRNLHRLKEVRVAMGVGGAFDFLAGTKKRAPRALQQVGLEWLYRLALEPKRIGRIFRATVVFPWRVLRSSRKP